MKSSFGSQGKPPQSEIANPFEGGTEFESRPVFTEEEPISQSATTERHNTSRQSGTIPMTPPKPYFPDVH